MHIRTVQYGTISNGSHRDEKGTAVNGDETFEIE